MKKTLPILLLLVTCYMLHATCYSPVYAQSSRPYSCPEPVYNQTDLLTPSCAESLTVKNEVSYIHNEANFWCEDDPWLEREWGGTVTLDLSETTIPFVGKKGQEDRRKYLADYFEGVCPYYTGTPCLKPKTLEEVLTAQSEMGPWQYLAPQSAQDDLKKQMVQRAIESKIGAIQEGAINDYLVEYNGESARLSEFNGHFPPEKPAERGKWEKETKWGRLWPAVPMFSREDTPGQILPYLGSRPQDQFSILNTEAQVEKVPHLARLYEVTKALQQLFLPQKKEEEPPPTPPEPTPTPASPVCGLAEPLPVENCEQQAVTDSYPNDEICCNPINIRLTAVDQFINPPEHYEECQYEWVCDPVTLICEWKLLNPSCLDWETKEVSRQIGIELQHPYLEEIWEQSTDAFTGFLNIFRPASAPEFEDLAAASQIKYRYNSGEVEPSLGKFYFPYLGGIQKAKEWVIQALNPAD